MIHSPPDAPGNTGEIRTHAAFPSRFLEPARDILVWLPPSYRATRARRYPVLYMHDGQQLFDPRTSTHGQAWEMDKTCARLISAGQMRDIMVVGVNNTPDRRAEYDPSAKGLDYARFLIEELKPFVDREYRTHPGRAHTAVAGSSMGGKISFHLAWNHPDVYFGAACLSPAFTLGVGPGDIERIRAVRGAPDVRFYLYCGAGDELERRLIGGQRAMARLLRARGFSARRGNLATVEDPLAFHHEAAWARHTEPWLRFLFGRRLKANRAAGKAAISRPLSV